MQLVDSKQKKSPVLNQVEQPFIKVKSKSQKRNDKKIYNTKEDGEISDEHGSESDGTVIEQEVERDLLQAMTPITKPRTRERRNGKPKWND